MARTYRRVEGPSRRIVYDENVMKKAVEAVKINKMSISKASKVYNIKRRTLSNRVNGKSRKTIGGQQCIAKHIEGVITKNLLECAKWGYPCDMLDLKLIISDYLKRKNLVVKKFKNNMPGIDYLNNFLKRSSIQLSLRFCNNIKRARANLNHDTINKYFDELEKSVENIPATNIVNYDETCLVDDPGKKKMLFKRGVKYPERVINSTKGSTSVMFACTGDGKILAPYVVYKAKHLFDSWTRDGPKNARYNRSKSGWFDAVCFQDWVESVAMPYLIKLPGKKILIGDNLASHLNIDLIEKCIEADISFIFLPPNSTHLTQPLDVAVFSPMKRIWKRVLTEWKIKHDSVSPSLQKQYFARLLNTLMVDMQPNQSNNIKSGFKKCGIIPLDRQQVLSRVPSTSEVENTNTNADTDAINESFTDILKGLRHHQPSDIKVRSKKVDVEPGKSVSAEEVEKLRKRKEQEQKQKKQNKPVKQLKKDKQTPGTSKQTAGSSKQPSRLMSTKKTQKKIKPKQNVK